MATLPRGQRRTSGGTLGHLPDAELLANAHRGTDSFEAFYRRHQRAVLSYLASRTRDYETALDLMAEVFAAAYLSRDGYEPEKGAARAWLFGIANNKVAESRRRDAKEWSARQRLQVPRFEYEDPALEQAEAMIDASRDGYLSGLGQLSEEEREAIMARVIDDRSYADIAAEANASQAAVRKRVSRGLARLGRLRQA